MSVDIVTVNAETTGPDAPVETPSVDAQSRPEWLPEKFESVEAMAKGYADLEAKQGAQTTEPTGEEQSKELPPETTEVKAPEGMEGMQDYFDEYAKDGALSEESYQALAEKHNVPKDMVDDYINLRNAANQTTADAQIQEWFNIAGGEEGYTEMSEWALTNLPPAEIEAIDKGLTSSNPQEVTNTVQSLYINYMQNGGKAPQLISGDNSMGTQGVQPIKSTYELTQLMSDPRYTNADKSYHDMIDKRLSISNIVG